MHINRPTLWRHWHKKMPMLPSHVALFTYIRQTVIVMSIVCEDCIVCDGGSIVWCSLQCQPDVFSSQLIILLGDQCIDYILSSNKPSTGGFTSWYWDKEHLAH